MIGFARIPNMTNARKSRAPQPAKSAELEENTMSARLLKVQVVPVYVVDDGEDLAEVQGQPTEVAAKAWMDFAASLVSPEMAENVVAQFLQIQARGQA